MGHIGPHPPPACRPRATLTPHAWAGYAWRHPRAARFRLHGDGMRTPPWLPAGVHIHTCMVVRHVGRMRFVIT